MKLNRRSKDLRIETIKLSKPNGGYHFGGSFSCVEILIQLYDKILTKNDIFIMSKGHGCWPFYVLLRERNLKPILEGHPKYDKKNGVYSTTGSLGHGLPTAAGIAFSKKFKKEKGKVFVLISDGECQEGTTWEVLNLARHHKLDNLVVILDLNGIQGSGFTNKILEIKNFEKICKNVGWETKTINGHDNKQILRNLTINKKKPYMVIAKTIKGKGVSFMENKPKWHANWLDDEHEKIAMEELKK